MTKKKKYTNCDKIYKNLQKYFLNRNFEVGERLPAERDISAELKVNRTTLRSALQRMVNEGLIERQVGVGSFFKVSPKNLNENYTKICTQCCPEELIETRMILEPEIAKIAALYTDAKIIEKLKDICRVENFTTVKELEEVDIAFNNMMAKISKNAMLNEVYSVVSDIRKKLNSADKKKVNSAGYACVETWRIHQHKIIKSLEKKDSKASKAAVKEKLNNLFGQYSSLN